MTIHQKILSAMKPFKGQILKTSEIITAVKEMYPSMPKGSILPNDHAENPGSCTCIKNDKQIFKKISRGCYKVF